MTRNQFLKLNFPLLPYCEMNMYRGLSTRSNESFHIQHAFSGITLNFFLCVYRGLLTIQTYNDKEKNPWKKYKEYFRGNSITRKELIEICEKCLG